MSEYQCQCRNPKDNDLGYCLGCFRWINYRERSQP
jgi:hypothetical protein